ncbi:MAG: universal stress protein [Actinobacteria bacterium]|nr:universal stress protein [Actinomycetota bacterium]
MSETASGPEASPARAGGTPVRKVLPGPWTDGEPAQQPSEPDWQPGRPGWPGSEPGWPPGRGAGPEWSDEAPGPGERWSGQPERGHTPGAEDFLHPVLAGYDGSEPSCHALAYAAGMARRLDRNLVVLYCTQTRLPPVGGFPFLPLTAAACLPGSEGEGDHLGWLKAELKEAADLAGLRVRIIERDGDPARELACTAAEYNTDAIVIGAPRRFLHRFAGSVPGWLARRARCPVVIVP